MRAAEGVPRGGVAEQPINDGGVNDKDDAVAAGAAIEQLHDPIRRAIDEAGGAVAP